MLKWGNFSLTTFKSSYKFPINHHDQFQKAFCAILRPQLKKRTFIGKYGIYQTVETPLNRGLFKNQKVKKRLEILLVIWGKAMSFNLDRHPCSDYTKIAYK